MKMSDPKFLNFLERKKLGGKFDLPAGEIMTRSVLSRLSPPRSLMSSTERPVPMPRVSTSTLTTTTTSTTTCSTTSSTTSTTTSTCSSSRSPLTSPSLHISNHSQALPTTLVPARQIISSEIGFFSKSQEESGVANDFDIESIDHIEIETMLVRTRCSRCGQKQLHQLQNLQSDKDERSQAVR